MSKIVDSDSWLVTKIIPKNVLFQKISIPLE